MLQQTRVEAVRPYYERWLRRFPTLESLAAAPRDEVMKAWEGLGYYSRARNLHRAVQEVAERYGGRVPDDPEAFRALPGVGRYTSGAVLSIAFGRAEPIVDGNVRRVFARLADLAEPTDRELWKMAEELVPGERPGDLNQAVMELGATICTPRSPRCVVACPVSTSCAAYAAGTQEQRPTPRRSRVLPHEHTATAVVLREGEVLLGRRPAKGRLGGMWEFPGTLISPDEDAAAAVVRAAREAGMRVEAGTALCSVDHLFTHVRVTYHATLCAYHSGEPRSGGYEQLRWVALARIGELALPKAQQKIAARLLEKRGYSFRSTDQES